MQNGEPLIYRYEFLGGPTNLFNFKTANAVSYNVRFKSNAGYVSPTFFWRDDFYEIVIDVASAPDPFYIPADHSVFPTVVAIISDFFANHQRVVLYICDDSDSRELARKRKFDNWYTRLGTELYEKYDLPALSVGTERYFASVFFRRDNPNRLSIITAFDRLGTGDK